MFRHRKTIRPNGTIGFTYMPRYQGVLSTWDSRWNLTGTAPELKFNGQSYVVPDNPYNQDLNTYNVVTFNKCYSRGNISTTQIFGDIINVNGDVYGHSSLSPYNVLCNGSFNCGTITATTAAMYWVSANATTTPNYCYVSDIRSGGGDILLDASGTGKVKFDSVQSKGLIIGSDTQNDNDLSIEPSTVDVNSKRLQLGVYNQAVHINAKNVQSGALKPLFIGISSTCNVFCGVTTEGDLASVFNTSTYKNVIAGAKTNLNPLGNILVGGVQIIGSSNNLVVRNLTAAYSIVSRNLGSLTYQARYANSLVAEAYTFFALPMVSKTTLGADSGTIIWDGEIFVLPHEPNAKWLITYSIPIYAKSGVVIRDLAGTDIPGTQNISDHHINKQYMEGEFEIDHPYGDGFYLYPMSIGAYIGKYDSDCKLHICITKVK